MSRDQRRRDRNSSGSIVDAILAGAIGGLTFNRNDEFARAAGDYESSDRARALHDERPLAFAAGELAGSAPWAGLGAGLTHAIAKGGGARTRLLTALIAGGLHGGAAGSGGFRPGEMSRGERAMDAALGAGIGAGVGGFGVASTRAARDLYDNLPAMTGRVQVPGLGLDTFERAALGQGTRRSAPLTVSLAGEGPVDERAARAIQSALSQDEAAMVRDTGRAVMGRFANADDGRSLQAFGSDNLGQSVDALRSYGAQSPGGASRIEEMVSALMEDSVKRQMRNMRAPKVVKAKIARQEADDFVRAMDDSRFHQSWLKEARKLDEGARAALAAKMVRVLRTRAKEARGGEAEAFQRYLREKTIDEKLRALGVNVGNLRGARKAGREIEAEVSRLRAMATRRPEASYNFRNPEDRDLSSRGALREEDARALLAALMRPQRAFAVTPDSSARVLDGAFERGVRFNPRGWFESADAEDVLGSVLFSQPVAAAVPTLGYAAFGRDG